MYNRSRQTEDLLDKNKENPPSFTVHLHPDHWSLNNGPKFLYQNQIAAILDDIRAHKIPVDFLDLFDNAKVPWYQGCMIVELHDYRPENRRDGPLSAPSKIRKILHPDSETVFADICALNRNTGNKWTDRDALEVEAKFLLATSEPLCLDPDPHLSRVANAIARVSTPYAPTSLKRKATAADLEEDEADRVRRTKILGLMNPRQGRPVHYSYRILDVLERRGKPTRTLSSASSTGPTNLGAVRSAPSIQSAHSNGATTPPSAATPPRQTGSPAPMANGRAPTPQQNAVTRQNSVGGHQSPPPSQAPFANQPPPAGVRATPSPGPLAPSQSPTLPTANSMQNIPQRMPTPTNPTGPQAYNMAAAMANARSPIPPQAALPPGQQPPNGYPNAGFLRQPPTAHVTKPPGAPNGQQQSQAALTPAQQQQQQQYRQQQLQQAQAAQMLMQQQRLQQAQQQQAQQNGRATPQQPQSAQPHTAQPTLTPQQMQALQSQWYQHYPHLRANAQAQQAAQQQGRAAAGTPSANPYYNFMHPQAQNHPNQQQAAAAAYWAMQQAQNAGRAPTFNGQPLTPEMQAALLQQMQLRAQAQQQAQSQQNVPQPGRT